LWTTVLEMILKTDLSEFTNDTRPAPVSLAPKDVVPPIIRNTVVDPELIDIEHVAVQDDPRKWSATRKV